MALLIECPSCERKLRVPDEFVGRSVRCPSCGETFPAPAAPAGAAAPTASGPTAEPAPAAAPSPLLSVPLDLELGDPAAPRPAADATQPAPARRTEEPPPRRREPEPEDEGWDESPRSRQRREFEPCPRCGDDVRRGAVVCPYCGLDLEEQGDGYTRQRRVRHDAEPHRGGTVLGLGIASLILSMIYVFALIGMPLGLAAWLMGRSDLRKMREGLMDPDGRKKTKDGWLCGIIGTFVSLFYSLITVLYLVLFILVENQPVVQPQPAPIGRQPWPPPPQAAPPQWQQPAPRLDNFTLSGPVKVVSLKPGQTLSVTLTVERLADYRGSVRIEPEVAPNADVSAAPNLFELRQGTTEAEFRITAAAKALPGEKSLRFIGRDDVGGRVLFDLRVKVTEEPKGGGPGR
jgi:predicted Zn finger-like uncharacterized protein